VGISNTVSQVIGFRLSGPPDVNAILRSAGFEIHRKRATCPSCSPQHARPSLTVAIDSDKGVWYCHRCGVGGSIRQLARAQGIILPPRRRGLAILRKQFFESWLKEKMSELSKEEHRLHKKARLAVVALSFPELREFEPAWEALRKLYDRERVFENFWSKATSKIGRYGLYRGWRKKHGLNRPKT
jgi:hypothetical protein